MAKFEITTPGGARYEIEAPDNASDAQVAEVIRHQFGGGQPKQKHDAYKDWTTYGKDLARTALGQGAALGFGDEIVAGVRSAVGGTPYRQALQEERDAVARFRDQNPGTAIASELVGGLATPALGAGRFIAGGANLLGRSGRSAAVGAGIGAVNAVGAAEGNDYGTYRDAIGSGAMVGAGVGAVIPGAVAAAQRGIQGARSVAQMRADNEGAGRLFVADKLRQNGLTEQDILADLARGQQARQFTGGQAELPEAIADVSPVMQRVVRGIKVGGSADDIIEPTLARRQSGEIDLARGGETGGQLDRLRESTRLAMRSTAQPLADQAEAIAGRRSATADRLFREANANSEPFDLSSTLQRHALEAQNLPDPAQRKILMDAVRLFDEHGYSGADLRESAQAALDKYDRATQRLQERIMNGQGSRAMQARLDDRIAERPFFQQDLARRLEAAMQSAGRQNAQRFGTNNVERFQKAKESLDDKISEHQGTNLGRLLTRLKRDALDGVFQPDDAGNITRNRIYREALDNYASQSELLNAAELGRSFARGQEDITPRMWRMLSEAEKGMVRKAWTEDKARGMGNKAAGPTSDFTGEFRKQNTQNDLRLMLPPTAGRSAEFPGGNRERLGEIISREHRISSTPQKVMGNSSTAEKAVDAIDIGRLARVTRYIRTEGGITQAAMASLSDALERMSAIKGEKARYLAQELLSTDPARQQEFLRQVAAEYGQHQIPRIASALNRWSFQIENAALGQATRQEGQRATFETRRANAPRGLIGLGSATR